MRSLLTILLLACLLAVAPVSIASADSGDGRIVVAQGGGKSLNEAVEQVRRQYNGRIVSAETRVQGGREVHYVKVLTDDGRVKTVTVNGKKRGNG